MKTSEFIKYFKNEGLRVYEFDNGILVQNGCHENLIQLKNDKDITIDINRFPFDTQTRYYAVIFKYLSTPPEEREEKKEYYLKLKHFNSLHNYLNLNINSGEYELSTIESTQQFKTKFTEKEIDDIPKGIKSHNWEYVEVI